MTNFASSFTKSTLLFFLVFIQSTSFSQVGWSQKSNFPDTRYGGCGFSIQGIGYTGLGWNPIPTGDFWSYNTFSDNWTRVADFPGPVRGDAVAFSIGKYAYVGTGLQRNALKDFYKFNPKTNKWSSISDFGGSSRSQATSFVIDSFAYVGFGAGSSYFKDWWKYDPSDDSWSEIASFPANERSRPTSFSIGGKGYIICGRDRTNFKTTKEVWEYDPVTNFWTQLQDFPGLEREGASAFVICNKGYLLGGSNYNNQSLYDCWEYDPKNDFWVNIDSLPDTTRAVFPTFVIESKGYIATGYHQIGSQPRYLSNVWEFTPDSLCSDSSLANAERIFSTSVHLYPNPMSEILYVSIQEGIKLEIRVFDITGNTIHRSSFNSKTSINVSDFSKGLLFYTIEGKHGIIKKGKLYKE
jgi:N-acetylneuraminic acid mutarotase